MPEPKEATGIKSQQVSRWAKRLNDRQAYRGKPFGKALRAPSCVTGKGLAPAGSYKLLRSELKYWVT
ncbi:MAG: hypothetical protein L0Z53_25150, partial [Acidobacteriales bacterium]|nr:hypothetical protein [Terriglobales bacterium]